MANSVPTLTGENFHIFEPSPIETSLVANVDNPMTPSARGNLFRYQTQNQLNGQNYQSQVDQMHRAQIAEAMMAQQTSRGSMLATALHDASGAPGTTDILRQLNILPQGVDTGSFDAGTQAAASAKNLGEGGRGLGALGMAGFTGLQPAAQSVAGPGVGQGPSALEKAAVINANGRVAARDAGGLASVSVPVGPPGPNQASVRMKLHPSLIPGLPPWMANGGEPTAPVDGGDDGNNGGDGVAGNPLLGPIPGTVPPPAVGSSTDAATQIRNDIASSKVPPQPQPDGSILYTGASGKKYVKRGS